MRTSTLSLSLVLLVACGDDDHGDHTHDVSSDTAPDVADATSGRPDFGSGDGTATVGDLIEVTDLANGVRRARINASGADLWVQLGLEDGGLVTGETGWDLAFQRILIRSAHPIAMADVAFEAATEAPAEGWVEDGDELAFDALGGWWDYDATNHTVAPKVRTFFVAVDEDTYFKVAVRDYYDDAGTSGVVTIDYAPVDPPSVVTVPTIVLKDGEQLDLATGAVVGDGDLAVVGGLMFETAAAGGAMRATGAWDAVTSTDTVGFVGNAELPIPGPPPSGSGGSTSPTVVANPVLSDWYDYDATTHAVTPKDVVFVVRARDGRYYKVRVEAYDATAGFSLRVAAIARAPEDHTIEVTAPPSSGDGGTWVYTSLRTGMSVLVTDPSTDGGWDLGFQGAMIRTNSGASGAGAGGAMLLGDGAIGEFVNLAGELVVDADLPIPGPPGSGTHAGNAVLEAFYDYDMTTHTLTVKPAVFAVAAADGSRARVKITAYASGVYTIVYTYAGPGHDAL